MGQPICDTACGRWCERPSSVTGGWGFAETYIYTYNGTEYPLTLALMYYSTYTGSEGWFPLADNYGAYAYNTGDANDFTFARYVGYVYYAL